LGRNDSFISLDWIQENERERLDTYDLNKDFNPDVFDEELEVFNNESLEEASSGLKSRA